MEHDELFEPVTSYASNSLDHLTVSTPGRICLFGEHQDYLYLPVIPCAISLRVTIEGKRRNDSAIHIDLPDISSHEQFSLTETFPYRKERDYFRSSVNVLKKHGYTFSSGFDSVVHGTIPISAGTSSSSALVVSWVNFLALMSDQSRKLAPEVCARYAYEAEVLEFHEAGGMMDQYAASFGGISVIHFHPQLEIQQIDARLNTFVIGDSGQPKDTQYILSHVKNKVLDIVRRLTAVHPEFSLHELRSDQLDQWKRHLSADQLSLLKGTVQNHELTLEAKQLLKSQPIDHQRLGRLLTHHQEILRDILHISTPKIDRMLDAALASGAYGGKINGSGGGGCMFAYTPHRHEEVAEAIARVGGKVFVVRIDAGTRIEV